MNLLEAELIKRCKSGDRGAFNELFKQYETRVINIAYGMLSDYNDACDAAQEVFIKVYRNIDSFKENSSLSTWIYRITANTCSDMLRKRQKRAVVISIDADTDDDGLKKEIPDSAPLPDEYIEHSEVQIAVRNAVMELSDEYREVITLCDFEDMSYDAIAEILECPVGTVKSRLNRARTALKKKLSSKAELFM